MMSTGNEDPIETEGLELTFEQKKIKINCEGRERKTVVVTNTYPHYQWFSNENDVPKTRRRHDFNTMEKKKRSESSFRVKEMDVATEN